MMRSKALRATLNGVIALAVTSTLVLGGTLAANAEEVTDPNTTAQEVVTPAPEEQPAPESEDVDQSNDASVAETNTVAETDANVTDPNTTAQEVVTPAPEEQPAPESEVSPSNTTTTVVAPETQPAVAAVQSVLVLGGESCYTPGELDVLVIEAPGTIRAEGESIRNVRVEGTLLGDNEFRLPAGSYSFTYDVIVTATNATESFSGSFVIEECVPEEPAYVLVLWKVVDSDGNGDIWEQRVFASLATDSTDLSQLDGAATQCGEYQVDLYDNSETTASLIAGGVLYGPNNPQEDFADIYGPTYKVFKVKDCTVSPPEGAVPTFNDVCGIDGDSFTVPENGEHYQFITDDQRVDGVGLVTVDLVADEGFKLPKDLETHWEHEFTNEPCPPTEIPVPEFPAFTDPCGPDNIHWNSVPEDTDEIDWTLNEDGSLTAAAKPGFAFAAAIGERPNVAIREDGVTFYLPEDSNVACPTTPPTENPPAVNPPAENPPANPPADTPDGSLAVTGSPLPLWLLQSLAVGGAGAILAGALALVVIAVRRRREESNSEVASAA